MASQREIDSFWAATLDRRSLPPLNARSEGVAESVPYFRERITYTSAGDATVVAHLSRPAGESRRWPAIITFPGYGGTEFGQMLAEAQRGYVILQVYPRLQGESGSPPDGDPEHLLRGIASAETYYYRGVYVDAVRGVDYLAERHDVDPHRIAVMGTSQGGAIALALAALDERIRAVVAHLPAFCDVRNNPALGRSPLNTPQQLDVFDYFDPVNLAPRIRVPTLLSSGGLDKVSTPGSIRAVFDRLGGVKSLFYEPELTHTSSVAFHQLSWQWIERFV